MTEIALSGKHGAGLVTLVDPDVAERLRRHSWHLTAQGYAATRIDGRIHTLHRLIVNALPREDTDHRNGNKLDNRWANLRRCTRSQNQANMRKRPGRTYKGVTRSTRRWRAAIMVDYRRIHLGYFDSGIEAARAYDAAAVKLFGEFALTNFPSRV